MRVCSTRRSFTWIAGVELADLVEEHGAERRAHLQPARTVLTAPVKAPRRWPNSSDSISVGDSADEVEGEERAGEVLGEACALSVEGDVAREADRARHELLARAGGAR